MRLVGLTGGIGSGKSTVSKYLIEKGAHIVDADVVAREIVEPGTKGLRNIAKAFGSGVLNEDGTLDRAKMGGIVFSDKKALEKLNGILHPILKEKIKKKIADYRNQGAELVVLDAALLFETDMDELVEETWLVYVEKNTQIQRLMKRDDMSEDEAVKRINAQMPLDEKIKLADYTIDNEESFEKTMKKIDFVLEN